MRVRLGWSGETTPNVWSKADVELEEEDLRRLMREGGLPDGADAKLPVRVCFQLLEIEAEIQLLGRLIKSEGFVKGQSRWTELYEKKNELMGLLKARVSQ